MNYSYNRHSHVCMSAVLELTDVFLLLSLGPQKRMAVHGTSRSERGSRLL